MKSTSAYYLLLFYTFALCKPVLPLIQDKLAHAFQEVHHLSTIHQHQGANHVDSAVAEAAQEQGNGSDSATKSAEPVSIHLVVQTLFTIPPLTTEVQIFATTICKVSAVSIDKHDPPPKYW